MLRLLLVSAVLYAAGCQRVSPQDCEKICWRFNELAFWEKVAAEGQGLPPDGRERLKAARQTEWDAIRKRDFDPGLENCVKECRRGAKPEDVACVEKAKTAETAQACLK
jgi:hypothetical protein